MKRAAAIVAAFAAGVVVGAALLLSLPVPGVPDAPGGASLRRDAVVGEAPVSTLLAWTPGRLPDGYARAVRELRAVRSVTVVRSGVAWMDRWRDQAGPPRASAPTYRVPVEVASIDRRSYAAFVPPADRGIVTEPRGEGAGSGAPGRAGAGPGPRRDPGIPPWGRGPGPVPGQGDVRRVRGTAAFRRHRGGAPIVGRREYPDRPRACPRRDPVPPAGDPADAGGPGGPRGPEPRPSRRSGRLRRLLLPPLHRTGPRHGPVAPLLGDRHRHQHLAGPHGTPADHRPPGGRGVRGPGLQVGRRVPDPRRNALRVRPFPLTVPPVRLS